MLCISDLDHQYFLHIKSGRFSLLLHVLYPYCMYYILIASVVSLLQVLYPYCIFCTVMTYVAYLLHVVYPYQGWEFAHLIFERIARFLSKYERMSDSLKKKERFTHSLIFGEQNERFAHIAHFL